MLIALSILLFIRPFIASLAFRYCDTAYFAALFCLLVAWAVFKRPAIRDIKPKAAIICFILALCVPAIFSGNKISAFTESYKYLSGILIFIACTSLALRDKEKIIFVLIGAGVLASLMAIYQYFFGFNQIIGYLNKEKISSELILDYVNRRRAFSPFITPNILGGYLIMIIPLAISYKRKAWIAITLFLALFLTKSVGAFASLIAALAIIFILQGRFKKRYLILSLYLLATLGLIIAIRLHAHKHLQPLFSAAMRMHYWRETWEMIKLHPFAGTGPGNFNLVDSRYSHCSYLQIWAETGITGIASFIWLVISVFNYGAKTLKESCAQRANAGLLCGFSAFLIHNLIDFSFFLPEVSLIWWAIAGMLLTKGTDTASIRKLE